MSVAQPVPNHSAPWLVMLYLAGDNNLTDEMVLAMQDLLGAGPPHGDKVVAQFDPSGIGIATQRYDFSHQKGKVTLEDYRDKEFNAPDTNTGSPQTLQDFIEWATAKDADGTMHRLLILSGHGSGSTEDLLMIDETSADALTIPELKQALANATRGKRKIDILGLDACYMSTAEVAFELRDFVKILIGGEGQGPAFGWPFRRILAAAKAARAAGESALSPRTLAELIVRTYIEHYADYDLAAARSADMAALDLHRIEAVADSFAQLVQQLNVTAKVDPDKLLVAHWYAQTYKRDQFVDLKDLSGQIEKKFGNVNIGNICQDLERAIRDCIILSGCCGCAYQHSHGLSVYFPWAFVAPEYGELDFATRTGWLGFLREFVHDTQREVRHGFQLPKLPTFRPGSDLGTALSARKEILAGFLHEAESGRQSRAAGVAVADAGYERAIVQRMRALAHVATLGRGGPRTLDKIVAAVAEADIPETDVSSEIARRFLRASAVGSGKGRYTGEGSRYTGEGSRYTGEGSRSVVDRAQSVKNLPAVIGKTYER